ncbi:hypothetical protein [Glaciihabitans sp. UYNi722]|uniref:hypothetical protein n=1 Tax=Glaciihabitans sp. UYNi722 TaxID=3156344 RepID=UPI00339595E2
MADETLRLPSTRFQAVFELGEKRAAAIPLPSALSKPEVFAEWIEEDLAVALYIGFEDGQLHVDRTAAGIEHHFHDASGETTSKSPWGSADTVTLLEWASVLSANFFARMPDLMEDIEEAAAWQEQGYPLYVCETDPAHLDLVDVEIEGEILTLPWLGAGQVNDEHLDGDNHPIALLWNPDATVTPDRMIARASVDVETGEPVTAAEPGIDWNAVGLPQDEVLGWLESTYMNHHITPDAAVELIRAVLERMGGLDADGSEER